MKDFLFPPITREQIKAYAEVSGDHNPIHLDESFAIKAGLPSVIAHGMLSMALASVALEAWGYDRAQAHVFEVKFKDKVFPGDQLVAKCDQIKKSDETDRNKISLEFSLLKSTGEEVLKGSASYFSNATGF